MPQRVFAGVVYLYTQCTSLRSPGSKEIRRARVACSFSGQIKRSVAPLERKKEKPGRVKDKVPVPGLYPDG